MRFRLLGPLEVIADDGRRVDPAAGRQRRLLLALLVAGGEWVSADRLVDVLWSQADLPRDPAAALRTYVSRLRGVLEPDRVGGQAQILSGGPDRYRLDVAGHQLDADAFEADLAEATTVIDDRPADALAVLDRALARWRGPALAEIADEHWARPEAARLESLRATAQEHRLRCLIDTGRHDEAVGALEQIVQEQPLRERPRGLLMLALDRCGRTMEASEVFHEFRELLAEESGLDPSADLQRLHLRLLSHSDAATFAATEPGRWDRVPLPRTALFGRDDDAAEVWGLLARRQLVTVTGPGGVGKTRLAAELAHRTREADGRVAFAELGPVTEPEGITDAVFDAIAMPAVGRRDGLDGLSRLFRSHRLLLVLDNCEHLVDAVSDVVERLVRELPELTVLATSREPLGLDVERTYRLRSLNEDSAAALLVERAAGAGFTGTFESEDRELVVAICRRLDGIPLAIEFAAARVAHLGVAQTAEWLDDRFWLLTGRQRTIARHQTLEAAIAWSYDLLDDDEQAVLRAAATFVDGFAAESLAAVLERDERATLDVLGELVGKSLVETDTTSVGRTRYRLLETVRLFALERLQEAGEAEKTRHAHAHHFLRRALAVAPQLDDLPAGVDRSMCRIRLDPGGDGAGADLANDLAALRWLDRQGDLAAVGRLAARIPTVLGHAMFLDPHGRWLARDDVMASLAGEPAELALYQTAAALNACYLGAFVEAERLGKAAMASATDPATRSAAAALTALADVGLAPEQVAGLVDHALEEAPEAARFTRLLLRGQRSLSLVMQGRLEEAVEQLEPHARLGDAFAAAEQLLVLHVLGDDERALRVPVPEDAYPSSAALWRYRWPLVRALAHAAKGEHVEAATALIEARRQVAISPVAHENDILLACGALAHHADDPERALELVSAVGRRVISPGSVVLSRHYRALAEDAVSVSRSHTIGELAADLDLHQLMQREVRRIASRARAAEPVSGA